MSPHLIVWRSHTQTLLWPASGAGWPLKGLGVASPDHKVGAHFEALDEGDLMASLDSRYTQVGFNLLSVQVCLVDFFNCFNFLFFSPVWKGVLLCYLWHGPTVRMFFKKFSEESGVAGGISWVPPTTFLVSRDHGNQSCCLFCQYNINIIQPEKRSSGTLFLVIPSCMTSFLLPVSWGCLFV